MVLVHGLGASHMQFSHLVQEAGGVIATLVIDLPGHGENVLAENEPIGFEAFADLILSLCDELKLEELIFAGISMGSALALICAAKRPERVQEVVAIRPSWLAETAPDHLSLVDRCGEWLSVGSIETALAKLEADPGYIELRDDVPLAAASVRGLFDRRHAMAHASVLSKMFHSRPFNSLNDLRNIKTPVVVIGTHADSLHPIAIANATANALPNATLKILPPRYLQPEKHQAALTQLILDKAGVAA